MTGYAFMILFGLPRIGKIFFRNFTGRSVEFQFVLVSLFVAAFLADLIGMHAIVGAFLAGLAINNTLPPRSSVAGQVLFLGESFFIPIFMMFIGMMLDPVAIVSNLDTILIGLALPAVVDLIMLSLGTPLLLPLVAVGLVLLSLSHRKNSPPAKIRSNGFIRLRIIDVCHVIVEVRPPGTVEGSANNINVTSI